MKHEDKKEDTKMDKAQDKAMVKKAVGMHDKQMHGNKKTDMSSLKKGGCAKMAFGGMASKIGNAVKARGSINPSAQIAAMRNSAPRNALSSSLGNKGQLPKYAKSGDTSNLGALSQSLKGTPATYNGGAMGTAMMGKPMKKGGSASARADGCATKGKTKGRIV